MRIFAPSQRAHALHVELLDARDIVAAPMDYRKSVVRNASDYLLRNGDAFDRHNAEIAKDALSMRPDSIGEIILFAIRASAVVASFIVILLHVPHAVSALFRLGGTALRALL